MLPADLGILRLATKSLLGSYSVPSDVLRDSALLRGAVQTFHATPDISILPEVDEATARLSASAGLLATLLGNAKTEPASITATMPVLAQAPAEIAPPLLAGLLAAALQRAITHSGLFYEAHLAQWVEGKRALAELQSELRGGPRPPASAPDDGTSNNTPTALNEATPTGAGRPGASPLPTDDLPLIRQQLHALESRHVVWCGELWPGQSATWEVSDERGQRADTRTGKSASSTWFTRVHLTLPRLGEITALLRLAPDGASVTLRAADPAAAVAIEVNQAGLHDALGAAGIVLQNVRIDVDAAQDSGRAGS